jgi:hypothetical protein
VDGGLYGTGGMGDEGGWGQDLVGGGSCGRWDGAWGGGEWVSVLLVFDRASKLV